MVLIPSSHEHSHTTHTRSPQTLYSSALESHRRRCRCNTPPSPAPSARCRRSEDRTDRFVSVHCSLCLTALANKNIPQKCVFSRLHQACLTTSAKGWKLFIILVSLPLYYNSYPLITHITIRWCSTLTFPIHYAVQLLFFKSWLYKHCMHPSSLQLFWLLFITLNAVYLMELLTTKYQIMNLHNFKWMHLHINLWILW